jgi:sugar phosphate isomerase/epimerase
MTTSILSKRKFLQLTATSAAACLLSRPASLFAEEKRKIPVGMQLYSVRMECAKDLDGTIAAVAKIGYQAVEFAGYYQRSAKDLRKLLDDNGLKCCGTHLALDALLGDELAKTVEFNKILGNRFLLVPSFPEKYVKTRQGWLEAAEIFNHAADQVKRDGMRVGFHNENIEFTPVDGELPMDIFFGHTKKEVIMQIDTGNAMDGGGDPVVYLKKYPGRAASMHIKPYSKSHPKALLGDDELPWPEIFNLCETIGGTEWYVMEYESDGYPPLVAMQKTFDVMKRWGKV